MKMIHLLDHLSHPRNIAALAAAFACTRGRTKDGAM
jgi:hypothetical protein